MQKIKSIIKENQNLERHVTTGFGEVLEKEFVLEKGISVVRGMPFFTVKHRMEKKNEKENKKAT